MLHEDQITDDALLGYEVLVLFDVELLPEAVARHIVAFVRAGRNCDRRLCAAATNSASRWPCARSCSVSAMRRRAASPGRGIGYPTPHSRPSGPFGRSGHLMRVLPKRCVSRARHWTWTWPSRSSVPAPVRLWMERFWPRPPPAAPVLVRKQTGNGQAFLLGFCLQDTYFAAWEKDDPRARAQLCALLAAITREAKIQSHVSSSNPDIEAAVRANAREGFLFVINHEAAEPSTTVRIAELPFRVGQVINLEDGQPLIAARDGAEAIRLTLSVPLGGTLLAELQPAVVADACTLWQLPNQTSTQMMSYVLQSAGGKVVVIDGGNAGDARYLRDFLTNLGGQIEAWFITHAHSDHFGALEEILQAPGLPEIKAIYGSLPDESWVAQYADESELNAFRHFTRVLATSQRTVVELTLGEVRDIDGMRIEILGVKNPEITSNSLNNSSVVLRVSDPEKSVLFLADLGVEGGDKLLTGPAAGNLRRRLCANGPPRSGRGARKRLSGCQPDVLSVAHAQVAVGQRQGRRS